MKTEIKRKVFSKTGTLFSPNSGEDQNKKVFSKTRALFSQIQVKTIKNLHEKWNTFFPKFRWKPKKGFHQKWNTFFTRTIQVDTYAQMHTNVKLLWGCKCRPYSNYWEDTVKLLWRIYLPIPPGFRHPCLNSTIHNFLRND